MSCGGSGCCWANGLSPISRPLETERDQQRARQFLEVLLQPLLHWVLRGWMMHSCCLWSHDVACCARSSMAAGRRTFHLYFSGLNQDFCAEFSIASSSCVDESASRLTKTCLHLRWHLVHSEDSWLQQLHYFFYSQGLSYYSSFTAFQPHLHLVVAEDFLGWTWLSLAIKYTYSDLSFLSWSLYAAIDLSSGKTFALCDSLSIECHQQSPSAAHFHHTNQRGPSGSIQWHHSSLTVQDCSSCLICFFSGSWSVPCSGCCLWRLDFDCNLKDLVSSAGRVHLVQQQLHCACRSLASRSVPAAQAHWSVATAAPWCPHCHAFGCCFREGSRHFEDSSCWSNFHCRVVVLQHSCHSFAACHWSSAWTTLYSPQLH